VNKLLHDPIQVLRDTQTQHAPMSPYLHAVEKLFKLEGQSPSASDAPADETNSERQA
jgi:hypothetical protein